MRRRVEGAVTAGRVLACLSPARAQDSTPLRVTGVIEHYFSGSNVDSATDLKVATRWLQVKGETPRGIGFTVGTFEKGTLRLLDENFAEIQRGRADWRVGRFRSAFGHSDWGGWYYSGFV